MRGASLDNCTAGRYIPMTGVDQSLLKGSVEWVSVPSVGFEAFYPADGDEESVAHG